MPRRGSKTHDPQEDETENATENATGNAAGSGQELAIYDAQAGALLEEQNAREQAESAMIQAVLGSVWSCRKPRDVVAGTSSGLKTVARGVGLGLTSLVALPYMGAKNGGAKGFVKGVGAGVVTCAASTVTGTVVGTGQIVRGVYHTPNAIMQKARGQVWNASDRKWERDWYSLAEEEAEVLGGGNADKQTGDKLGEGEATGSASASRAEPKRPAKTVVDRTLYDLLGVPPEANDSEVRRAFHKKSLALHPDKNPDNPEATKDFQAVSEAYRILGDEDRRRAYDEHGQDSAAAGMPKIEPVVFFAALFGSHHFEPWIGRLRLAQDIDGDLQSLLRDAVTGSEDEPPAIDILKVTRARKKLDSNEVERQVKLAVALRNRIDPVVHLEGEARQEAFNKWESEQAAEISTLAQVPCGPEMMYIIGWVYSNRARQFFAGGMLKRVMAQVEGRVHMANSKASLAKSVGSTCMTVNGIMKTAEKKKKSIDSPKKGQGEDSGPASEEDTTCAAGDAKAPDEEAAGANSGGGLGSSDGASDAKAKSKGMFSFAFKPKSRSSRSGASPIVVAAPSASSQDCPAETPANEDERLGPAAAENVKTPLIGGSGPTRPEASGAASDADVNGDDADAATGHHGESDEASSVLPPGTLVVLRDLKSAPELNNEVGMICGFEAETERYLVQILPDIGMKKLKRDNLIVLEAGGFTDGGGGPSSSSSAPPGAGGAAGAGDGQWAPGGGDEAEINDALKDCMPLFHDAFWSATALDIEFTLGKVIQKVLRDMSVDNAVRRNRAEALLRLGRLMQEPAEEQRRKAKAEKKEEATSPPSAAASSSPQGAASAAKRSMLTRFKPRAFMRPSAETKTKRARDAEMKQKRMEAAMAMMIAGASTEDVDEMAAARSAMEAEMEGDGGGF